MAQLAQWVLSDDHPLNLVRTLVDLGVRQIRPTVPPSQPSSEKLSRGLVAVSLNYKDGIGMAPI